MDEFLDTSDIVFEEPEEIMAAESSNPDTELPEKKKKKKVIDNATNMTEVDMCFEIEEIELNLSRVGGDNLLNWIFVN